MRVEDVRSVHWPLGETLVTSLTDMLQLTSWVMLQSWHATSYHAAQHEVVTQYLGLLAGCCCSEENNRVLPQKGLVRCGVLAGK